jgi:hypothetical protein
MSEYKNPLNKKQMGLVRELLKNKDFLLKGILEQWNAETPHFGGVGPHRYNGKDKECCYCLRPKTWTFQNAGLYARIVAEDLKPKRGAK